MNNYVGIYQDGSGYIHNVVLFETINAAEDDYVDSDAGRDYLTLSVFAMTPYGGKLVQKVYPK